MSFKSRLIEHCKEMNMDCPYCSLREPCAKTNDFSIPSHWGDYSFDEMRSNTWEYMRSMSEKMSEISKLMLDASEDDLAEIKERWST